MIPDPETGVAARADTSASRLARRIGRRIREARLHLGLSRNSFGEKIGVSGQQVHKYETGRDCVPLHRLLVIAAFCGVAPQMLWSDGAADSASRGVHDMSTLQLVRAFKRIGDARIRKKVLELVKQMARDK